MVLCQPRADVVMMETNSGSDFSGSCCRSLGTDLVLTVVTTQWGTQASDLQTHWTVPASADLMFSHVRFPSLSANGLSIKIPESEDGESVRG